MAEGLYKFEFDCGRQGYLSGAFIAEADEIASLVGQDVYFGEVLGKHSEIYGVIEEGDIMLVTDDPQVVATLKAVNFGSGHNPLQYLEEE